MKNINNNFDVIVIGGGPAGMIAAGRAAEKGKRVLLLEKNKKLGEKLKITGGGRCNITNAEDNIRKFLKNYGKMENFLYSIFSKFNVQDTISFFEKKGLPLVIEANKRAFPKSQKALDVFLILEKYLQENKVIIKNNSPVSKILIKNKEIVGVVVGDNEYRCSNLILATGGLSHPETGSTGDGFKWLDKLGHKITKPSPDIVPLIVKEKWVKDLSGVSLSFMKINFYLNEVKKFSKTGKVLFTHFGLSGPLILNSAKKIKELLKLGKVTASIDLFPDTDLGTLEKRLIKVFDANKNKDLKNIFEKITPEGTDKSILSLLNKIDPDKKVHSITKEERKIITRTLKALPLTIEGMMGFDRAVVSDGGVDLRELETKNMSSKFYPNLFIIGDLLNINRPSGGFSLQLCWTTGYVAGDSV